MAIRVEARKEVVVQALEMALASQKRLRNTTKQPAFIPIIEKDMAELQTAIGSITEVK